MRVVLVVLGLVLLAVVPAVPASHQPTCPTVSPANDCRAHAASFAARAFDLTMSTRGATREPGEPAPSIGSTVWWTFTAFRDSTGWADTYHHDVAFVAYALEPDGNLTPIGGGDWYSIGMSYACEAGKTYLLQAGLSYEGEPVDGGVTGFHLRGGTCQLAPEAPRAPALTVARTSNRGELQVSWTTPDDGGSDLLSYRVYRSFDNCTSFTLLTTTTPSVLSLLETGLEEARVHCYQVSAVNGVGEGVRSGLGVAIPRGLPRPPALIGASGGVGENRVAWGLGNDGGSPLEAFRVYGAPSAGGPFALLAQTDAAARTYVETGLGDRVTRHYYVTQVTEIGESAPSTVVTATTQAKPTAPRNVDTGPGFLLRVRVTWDAPEDAGGLPILSYSIYRGEKGGPLSHYWNVGPDARSMEDPNVGPLDAYDYAVVARNALGVSPFSNRACGELVPTPRSLGGC